MAIPCKQNQPIQIKNGIIGLAFIDPFLMFQCLLNVKIPDIIISVNLMTIIAIPNIFQERIVIQIRPVIKTFPIMLYAKKNTTDLFISETFMPIEFVKNEHISDRFTVMVCLWLNLNHQALIEVRVV